MSASLSERIATRVPTASNLYSRLILVVGAPRSGKTTALIDLASNKSWPVVNVNLTLSERLLELTTKQRALRVARLLDEIVSEQDGDVLILDNVEVLFSLELQQDPLKLLQGLTRNRTVIAAWAGGFDDETLTYADTTHPEFRNYRRPDAIIVPVAQEQRNAELIVNKESA
jgi:hypothetical protein